VNLGAGRSAAPDFCVRVECARQRSAARRDEGIPFLLSVLRAGRPRERVLTPEESLDDLAWAQRRAAEALPTGAARSRSSGRRPPYSDRQAERRGSRRCSRRPQEKKR
jgi:hypothetical protein